MGLLFWLVAAPMFAAVLMLFVQNARPGFYHWLATGALVVALGLAMVAWTGFNTSQVGFQHLSSIPWFTLPNVWLGASVTIGLSFGVDGLSLALLTLGILISLFVVIAVPGHNGAERTYLFWVLLTSTGVFGIFTALDLFTFLFALELTLFSIFFLIYLFGEQGRHKAAFKFIIYRGFATVLLLVSFVGVAYGAAGGLSASARLLPTLAPAGANATNPVMQNLLQTAHATPVSFSVPEILQRLHTMPTAAFPTHWRMGLFLVLLFAVFIEEAYIPFHTWFLTTSVTADTGTNMLIGGILTKTGAYVLIRFGVGFFPDQVRVAGTAIAVIGVVNILYAAFAAWAQKDWRKLIAYSSISHMGIVLLGIAAMNPAGLQGAMFMLISSGLLTALLFYITSALRERTKTILIPHMGGLSKPMPMLSGFLLVAALGSLGLPLTSGFISEFQAFIGGFGSYPGISFVGVIGLILSATYLLYAIRKTTFGVLPQTKIGQYDARPIEYVPIVTLTGLVILIGVYPNVIGFLFNPAVHALVGIGG